MQNAVTDPRIDPDKLREFRANGGKIGWAIPECILRDHSDPEPVTQRDLDQIVIDEMNRCREDQARQAAKRRSAQERQAKAEAAMAYLNATTDRR